MGRYPCRITQISSISLRRIHQCAQWTSQQLIQRKAAVFENQLEYSEADRSEELVSVGFLGHEKALWCPNKFLKQGQLWGEGAMATKGGGDGIYTLLLGLHHNGRFKGTFRLPLRT
jgi:hypothetical protein